MKHILFFLIILSSSKATAQNSPIPILEAVLTDCDVTKYISEYGEIDTSDFVLSGDEGDYVFHHGTVDFQVANQKNPKQYTGTIKKIKISHAKSVVKIYFRGGQQIYYKSLAGKTSWNRTMAG